MVEPSRPGAGVDVVIVGAGAAGSLAAARLAAAGKSVTVLESGPAWTVQSLVSSQIWARRLKWGGPRVVLDGANPFGHSMAMGWGLGGAALHHYANWPRLRPEDFRLKTLYGRGADWPISYEELRPWYDLIQGEIGISGDAEAEVWRPPGAPYSQPPFPTFPQAETIAKGFAARGLRTAPAPLAILTEPKGDRAPCLFDGWCDAGCPTGALANPLVTYQKDAVRLGARFLSGCTVTRVNLDGRGRAAGVAFVDAKGEQRTLEAAVVILAASAIQTPRLLLASAGPGAERGVANSSGLVGQGFMAHALTSFMGIFDTPQDNHLGVSGGNLVCRDGWEKTRVPGGFGSREWVIASSLKPNDLIGIAMSRPDLFGQRLHAFMRDDAPRIAHMGALFEPLPLPQNRIELATQKDAYGVPMARLTYALAPETLALVEDAKIEGVAIMKAAGAKAVWTSPIVTNHALGGTPMGSSPADSVTDSYGRTWDAPNLFIYGGGLFPTAGAAGPTFTIHAVTRRAVDHLIDTWKAATA